MTDRVLLSASRREIGLQRFYEEFNVVKICTLDEIIKTMDGKKIVLQEIIDDLIDVSKSLMHPLMKLNYFARLIKNQELIEYTNNEIKGYPVDYIIPDYRKTPARILVDASSYYIETQSYEIPISFLPMQFQEHFLYLQIREGIYTVEKMAKEMVENGKQEFQKLLPLDLIREIQPVLTSIYKSNPPLIASAIRVVGNGNVLLDISGSVRTQLLEFVMSLAENLGYDIEINELNRQKINNTVNNYMNTIITTSGDGNVINNGNENTISNSPKIEKGNLQQLSDELRKHGIDEEDITALASILNEEGQDLERSSLSEKSTNWILDVTRKALNGVGKISTGVTSNLLATMIKDYYGHVV